MDNPAHNLCEKLGIKIPIIQAPMAGVDTPELAVAVTKAGGLGSLACAMLSPDEIYTAWHKIRQETAGSINLNFFCHTQTDESDVQQKQWRKKLAPYYAEFGLDIDAVKLSPNRMPFDEEFCRVVEDIKPPVISFHFGLPAPQLLSRVKAIGAIVMSSATTLEEAVWLEQNGCDVIIAQGVEAGGHRAMFLDNDIETQSDTSSLVKQMMGKVTVPVVAAGGIAEADDVRHFLSLGVSAVQLGTAYLFCPESRVSPLYRQALQTQQVTEITNVFSGRPARGIVNRFIRDIGPICSDAPDFPYASALVNPLRQASERAGKTDFMQMWSGTKRVPHHMNASDLTRALYTEIMKE